VSPQYRRQPFSHRRDFLVHPLSQLVFYLSELPSHPFPHCMPLKLELASAAHTADVGESQEVESLWTSLSSSLSVFRGKTPEFQNTSFLRMKF
jgi:hypothetical protein